MIAVIAPKHNVVPDECRIVLSFDLEEHYRIEAAAGLPIDPAQKVHYAGRLETSTRWLLEQLEGYGCKATFFILGECARNHAPLVRAIHDAGHEVASHGWDHRRVLHLTPDTFRDDVGKSKDVVEQITGAPVLGYRAPTFSIDRRTPWAIDVLAELGFLYDSSIYPIRHDRYGVPGAPRTPFIARGQDAELLELPPATLRLLGANLPVGGGGYFRLLPLFLLEWAVAQVRRRGRPPVAVLYFHPWEFDPGQDRLSLGPLNRFRTYVGISRSCPRFGSLLQRHCFLRAADVATQLGAGEDPLPGYALWPEPFRKLTLSVDER